MGLKTEEKRKEDNMGDRTRSHKAKDGLKRERNGKKGWPFAQGAPKQSGWLKRKNKRKEVRLGFCAADTQRKEGLGLQSENKRKEERTGVLARGTKRKAWDFSARTREKKNRWGSR